MQIEAPQSIGKGTYAHWASEQCGRMERKGETLLPSPFLCSFDIGKKPKNSQKSFLLAP
jgi:hypothetical protein